METKQKGISAMAAIIVVTIAVVLIGGGIYGYRAYEDKNNNTNSETNIDNSTSSSDDSSIDSIDDSNLDNSNDSTVPLDGSAANANSDNTNSTDLNSNVQ